MEVADYRDLEDASLDIPKNSFRSVVTWGFYESTKSSELFVMVVWYSCLLFDCYNSLVSTHLWTIQIYFDLLIISIFLSPAIWLICGQVRREEMISRNTNPLAETTKEVFSSQQETLTLGWDKVACRLNRKFYDVGDWKTLNCFFDGSHCESFFRMYVLKAIHEEEGPESRKKLLTYCNEYLSAGDRQPLQLGQGGYAFGRLRRFFQLCLFAIRLYGESQGTS